MTIYLKHLIEHIFGYWHYNASQTAHRSSLPIPLSIKWKYHFETDRFNDCEHNYSVAQIARGEKIRSFFILLQITPIFVVVSLYLSSWSPLFSIYVCCSQCALFWAKRLRANCRFKHIQMRKAVAKQIFAAALLNQFRKSWRGRGKVSHAANSFRNFRLGTRRRRECQPPLNSCTQLCFVVERGNGH